MLPDPQRVAYHQAGHAIVQTLVGRKRFAVCPVSINIEQCETWRGFPVQGEIALDRETFLGLYEFGLVTLSGIAAEDRYLLQDDDAENPLVAISDLAAWQEKARDILQDDSKVQIVSLNIMRKLHSWLAEKEIWSVVEQLAKALLEHGTVEGDLLDQILAPLEQHQT
jgi:hypothetical protein